ncbi:hypothetical protein JKP88DRAFT_264308 [Tribonema minus]|uniref:Rieske domain-containing protein n=1 Tax=Tribonema minus TaxID=303371 RepID=A0A835YPR5_9STRA|nr:hypothetical protein JKP88DRAFT_264308 [Tribonema minus]
MACLRCLYMHTCRRQALGVEKRPRQPKRRAKADRGAGRQRIADRDDLDASTAEQSKSCNYKDGRRIIVCIGRSLAREALQDVAQAQLQMTQLAWVAEYLDGRATSSCSDDRLAFQGTEEQLSKVPEIIYTPCCGPRGDNVSARTLPFMLARLIMYARMRPTDAPKLSPMQALDRITAVAQPAGGLSSSTCKNQRISVPEHQALTPEMSLLLGPESARGAARWYRPSNRKRRSEPAGGPNTRLGHVREDECIACTTRLLAVATATRAPAERLCTVWPKQTTPSRDLQTSSARRKQERSRAPTAAGNLILRAIAPCEGFVDPEPKRLVCAYHGWEFEGDGRGARIPQAEGTAEETALRSRRCCLEVLPTQVRTGLVWVWRDTSPEGLAASAVTPPQADDAVDGPDFDGWWYMRDVPFSDDVLIENLGDPAHVPFAHHNVISDRSRAEPLRLQLESAEDAVKLNLHGSPGYLTKPHPIAAVLSPTPSPQSCLICQTPGWRLKHQRCCTTSDNLSFWIVNHMVPTAPGRSRFFVRQSRNFLRSTKPRYKEHLFQHTVLDSDNMIIKLQEHAYNKVQLTKQYEASVFMPSECDTPVRAFRKWYRKNPPQWAPGVQETYDNAHLEPSRFDALERYESHTKHCASCRLALLQTQQRRNACLAASVLLLAAAAVLPPRRPHQSQQQQLQWCQRQLATS